MREVIIFFEVDECFFLIVEYVKHDVVDFDCVPRMVVASAVRNSIE